MRYFVLENVISRDMRSKSNRFKTPAWHWALHLPENRFIPKASRRFVGKGTRQVLDWSVAIPVGFSLAERLSYLDCKGSALRRQSRRLEALQSPGASRPETWCQLAHSFPLPYAVRVNVRKSGSARCWLLLTDGARPLAYAQRTVDFRASQVAHDYLAFVPSAQSKGFGAQILANALSVYSRMGLSAITLVAGLSAGSAVWPRLGFMPDSVEEWARLRLKIRGNLANLEPTVFSSYLATYGRPLDAALDAVVADDDPRAIFDLVDLDPSNRAGAAANLRHGIASTLLSGGHWRGRLELKGPGCERLLTYLLKRGISLPAAPG